MKDTDPERAVLRQQIVEAAETCTDTSLLDLIYKLLMSNEQTEAG